MPAVRTVLTLFVCTFTVLTIVFADDPFGNGRDNPFGNGEDPFGPSKPKVGRDAAKLLKSPAEIYEVSKGAKDRLMLSRVYSAVSKIAGEGLTRDEFVRRLKDREHFEIRLAENCKTCNGWKRILSESTSRGPDGKIPCPRCGASGKRMKDYKVVWRKGVPTHKGDRRNKYISALRRELGDRASSVEWLNHAKAYDGGEFSDRVDSQLFAHAAYVEAMEIANNSWRVNEPKDSNWNKLQRQVIDRCLIGIADTAPKYPQKNEQSQPPVLKADSPPPKR